MDSRRTCLVYKLGILTYKKLSPQKVTQSGIGTKQSSTQLDHKKNVKFYSFADFKRRPNVGLNSWSKVMPLTRTSRYYKPRFTFQDNYCGGGSSSKRSQFLPILSSLHGHYNGNYTEKSRIQHDLLYYLSLIVIYILSKFCNLKMKTSCYNGFFVA